MSVLRQFGKNLRILCSRKPSIAHVARDLDINKVQFHRYLNSESYPKPPVLKAICDYFGVDARIMLEPLDSIEEPEPTQDLTGLFSVLKPVEPGDLPNGFYMATRNSARLSGTILREVWRVSRSDTGCVAEAFVPPDVDRTFRGPRPAWQRRMSVQFFSVQTGVVGLIPEPGVGSLYFTYFWRPPTMPANTWGGFSIFATPEDGQSHRAVRLMLELLPNRTGDVLAAARRRGYAPVSTLTPQETIALQPGTPFR